MIFHVYKNVGACLFRFVTIHAFDGRTGRQTDRQTDSFLMARLRCGNACSAVKSS